ncbi:MAG: (2Fe-2S)-binding protein [Thermodesulfobacteriota bacterium]|nr:(2Fe-2S)-binding protein [Thermodesulfobacteriota bacterium]
MNRQLIELTVNGDSYEVAIAPHRTLLEVLREDIGLTGTKEGCDLGECGNCTVIMDGKAVLSCLILALDAREKEILTIEGLAEDGELHTIQKSFVEQGAVQCGFCSPGMIMTAKTLLDKNSKPTEEEIRKGISGNLCRCTGYAKIVEAISVASEGS